MVATKDQSLLRGVSARFTEETLKDIFRVAQNGKKVEINGWDFGEASSKGDSYLSTVNRVKVTGIVDGKHAEISLVVKSLPNNIGRRKTYRSSEFFHNEIIFYTEIVPKFQEFLREKGQGQVLCIPRHLASLTNGEDDYIALEDVSLLGYGRISRQSCINFEECAMLLKTLARFHAISFAFKDQRKRSFATMIGSLRETYYSEEHWDWYKRFNEKLIGISLDAIAKEYPGSEALKRFMSYKLGDFFKRASEFCNRARYPTSVVTQGDCWAPNFLGRKVDGKLEALMLDFQLARCVSPILDLSFCMYSCTDKELWDEKFDEILRIYHEELSCTVTLLGSDPKKVYSWDTFMDEVKEQFGFGIIFAMESIPFSLLDEAESFDLDSIIVDENAVNIADVWTIKNIETKQGRLRLSNAIVHGIEKGFL